MLHMNFGRYNETHNRSHIFLLILSLSLEISERWSKGVSRKIFVYLHALLSS